MTEQELAAEVQRTLLPNLGEADGRSAGGGAVVNQRFPRAEAVLEATAAADLLRRAAAELDQLAGDAHTLEPGTLRRRLRSVGLEVAFQMNGEGAS